MLQPVYGKWTVAFEEGGMMSFDCSGELLGMIVNELDAIIGAVSPARETMKIVHNASSPPYEVVSLDEIKQMVVVRRKAS